MDGAFDMAGSVMDFTDGNWKAEVLDSSIPVMVDFWAPWCSPCRMLGPTIEKLAGEYEGKIKVGKMNTDENQDTPGSLRISAIPTVIVFKDGREVDRLLGVNTESKYKASLDKLITSRQLESPNASITSWVEVDFASSSGVKTFSGSPDRGRCSDLRM